MAIEEIEAFPRMVAADIPGQGHMYYLIDDQLDFIAEVREFLDWKMATKRAPATIKAYCFRLSWYYRFLTQKNLDIFQVTPADLTEFVIWLCNPYRDAQTIVPIHQQSPLTATSMNLILQTVGSLYHFLVRRGRLASSPVVYVDIPRGKWLKEGDLLAHTHRGQATVQRMDWSTTSSFSDLAGGYSIAARDSSMPIPPEVLDQLDPLLEKAVEAMKQGETCAILSPMFWDAIHILRHTGTRAEDLTHLKAPDDHGRNGCLEQDPDEDWWIRLHHDISKELRQKQHDIDRLYGKLAAGSQLTDADLRHALASALQRLTTQGLEPETGAK